jgi:hypothetical protein
MRSVSLTYRAAAPDPCGGAGRFGRDAGEDGADEGGDGEAVAEADDGHRSYQLGRPSRGATEADDDDDGGEAEGGEASAGGDDAGGAKVRHHSQSSPPDFASPDRRRVQLSSGQ